MIRASGSPAPLSPPRRARGGTRYAPAPAPPRMLRENKVTRATPPPAVMKWQGHPNLRARPAKPSLNRGPVQRRARRALLALGEASTSEVAAWTHRKPTRRRTRHTRVVFGRIAEIVGRAQSRGRPWLWRLRDSKTEERIARSTTRPSFGLPELTVASHIWRLASRDAAKSLLSTLVSESSGECRVD